MYEHRSRPLIPRAEFYRRLARSFALGTGVAVGALAVGMLGYHHFEKMSWVDAYTNASMILSGMGPVGNLETPAGKIFAGTYALFSGLAFITSIGIIFTPIYHRFLHKFHLEEAESEEEEKPDS